MHNADTENRYKTRTLHRISLYTNKGQREYVA